MACSFVGYAVHDDVRQKQPIVRNIAGRIEAFHAQIAEERQIAFFRVRTPASVIVDLTISESIDTILNEVVTRPDRTLAERRVRKIAAVCNKGYRAAIIGVEMVEVFTIRAFGISPDCSRLGGWRLFGSAEKPL